MVTSFESDRFTRVEVRYEFAGDGKECTASGDAP